MLDKTIIGWKENNNNKKSDGQLYYTYIAPLTNLPFLPWTVCLPAYLPAF